MEKSPAPVKSSAAASAAAKVAKPSAPAKPTPADLAKAVLRRMATERLEPTPSNYARAWRAEGGDEPPPVPLTAASRGALQDFAARVLPTGVAREPLVDALATQRWEQLASVLPEDMVTPAQQAEAWAELIDRLVRQLERGHKRWTPGRKKESLQHVLGSARSDVQRLQQRLRQLVGSWDDEGADPEDGGAVEATADTAVAPDGPPPVAGRAAPAVPTALDAAAPIDLRPWQQVCAMLEGTVRVALPPGEPRADEVGARLRGLTEQLRDKSPEPSALVDLQAACDEVQRVLQHRHHLVGQLGVLINDLTEGLGDLAEDQSWVRGQCEAMQGELAEGLSARGVRAVGNLLRGARLKQQQLRAERSEAREALKQLIHRMLQDIGELGSQTGRFNQNLGRYAEVIGQADSLEGLTQVVREMVDETRTVHALVSQTTERLGDEHQRATVLAGRVRELEEELKRLSDEVSTDQLTQIANRRGLIKRFEAESARAARQTSPLAVAILDLDNFKRLNDTFGHQTGDEALKFLSRRVGETLRPTDSLARYGGEEFVVLLPDTPVEEAQKVLTRVQRLLSAELFMHEDKQTFVTFSAGVTPYRENEPLEAALQRADEALYEAKRSGKNRTCIG